MRTESDGPRSGAPRGTGIRKRRRHMRSILKEGVEAALRASPEVLEKCKPKTNYGNLVRGLVLEAAKCKATPLKTLMSLIDWEPDEDEEDGAEILEEGRRDWSPEGVWETMPEPEPAPDSRAAHEAGERARAELKRRLTRLVEAGQHEHVARIAEAIRSGNYGYEPEPLPTG